jgi:hypothetical protein
MDSIQGIWQWVQRIAGILMVVCLCLYVVRCVTTGQVVSFDRFDHYMRGLVRYIFA